MTDEISDIILGFLCAACAVFFMIVMKPVWADWRVSWNPPTQHTDGTAITDPISYTFRCDDAFTWSGTDTMVDGVPDSECQLRAVVLGLESDPVVVSLVRRKPNAPLGFSVEWYQTDDSQPPGPGM